MKKDTATIDFGKKMAELRKSRGFTQQKLGDLVGVSKRVIAYYEGETKYPPAHLIIPLAKALNLTTDELLGAKKFKEELNPNLAKVWRKLKIIESFSEKEKKAVLQYVDIIAEKNKSLQGV